MASNNQENYTPLQEINEAMEEPFNIYAALTAIQQEINEAKREVSESKAQLRKAIEEGKPDAIRADITALYAGASSNLLCWQEF